MMQRAPKQKINCAFNYDFEPFIKVICAVELAYQTKLKWQLRNVRDYPLLGQGALQDVDYRAARRLNRALFNRLLTGAWVAERQNVMITGPTPIEI